MKSRRLQCAGYVAQVKETKNEYRISTWKTKRDMGEWYEN
jgi:hypothetical protein